MWFEFEGAPLHWQLPIGVLFDLLAGAEAAESELPWRLIVHFQAFPSGTLLRSSPKEAEQLLLNALKERDGELALTSACAAGGLGVAMVLERAS